ncbi:hypothetical protein JCM11251_001874 [Rhodosporidiobolus azoricus]
MAGQASPLPPELLLPILVYATHGEPLCVRYDFLLSCCRVSRTFCGIAQTLLVEDAKPASFLSWKRLTYVLHTDRRLAYAVRRVHLSQAVLKGWHSLSAPGDGSLEILEDLPNLQTLLLHVDLDPEVRQLPALPSVQHLSVPHGLFFRTYPGIANPVPFPFLRYLSLTSNGLPDSQHLRCRAEPPPSLRGIVAPVAAAEHIAEVFSSIPILWTVPWQAFVDFMPPWRSFPSQTCRIKHLYIHPIRWTPPRHYLDELTRRLSTDPTLADLEVLYLPKQWAGVGTEAGLTMWRKVLREKGAEVEYEQEEQGWCDGEEEDVAGLLPHEFMRRCEAEYLSRHA